MTLLRTPRNRLVKVVEQGSGTPIVFLHSGVGSAGEWRGVFAAWPSDYRLVAIEALRGGSGLGDLGHCTLDDFADQVLAAASYVGRPVNLVGFSWGGATALHVAATSPDVVASVAVIEPEAYSLLDPSDGPAFTTLRDLSENWRAQVAAGNWHAAFAEFIDFYNGPGYFASWPATRRDAFLEARRALGDMWQPLLEAPITVNSLASIAAEVHVVEGSETSIVDRKLCDLVLMNVKRSTHSVIEGAGHMMPLTHSEELARVLLERLR